MEEQQVKDICAKFPQLELEVSHDDVMPFYRCYVKNVNAVDDSYDRVILFGYSTSEDSVKYSRYVSLNLAQIDGEGESEVTFPDPYNEIYLPEKLEKEIKISLLSIRVLEEAKKKFHSNLKKLELESDFEQGENDE